MNYSFKKIDDSTIRFMCNNHIFYGHLHEGSTGYYILWDHPTFGHLVCVKKITIFVGLEIRDYIKSLGINISEFAEGYWPETPKDIQLKIFDALCNSSTMININDL